MSFKVHLSSCAIALTSSLSPFWHSWRSAWRCTLLHSFLRDSSASSFLKSFQFLLTHLVLMYLKKGANNSNDEVE